MRPTRLNQALNRAAAALDACERLLEQALGPVKNPPEYSWDESQEDHNARHRAIDFFIISLNRLRAASDDIKEQLKSAKIRSGSKAFDVAVPRLTMFRDVAEHFDEYDAGGGKWRRKPWFDSQLAPSIFIGPDSAGLDFGGQRLLLPEACAAGRELFRVVLDEVVASDPDPLTIDAWPRLKWADPGLHPWGQRG